MKKYLLIIAVIALCNNVFSQTKLISVYSVQLDQEWKFREAKSEKWMIAAVPGCVHDDLYYNGIIDDPFLKDNEKKIQWIEAKDWEYQTILNIASSMFSYEHIELNFEGLDTYADVYVNDNLVYQSDNMFVGFRIDIRKFLVTDATNKLRIYFHSPVNYVMKQTVESAIKYPADNEASNVHTSVFTRKAAFQYGWDFAPRLVTSGIWRSIKLEAWNGARIRDCFFKTTFLSKDSARIEANLEIESDFQGNAQIIIRDDEKSFKPLRIMTSLMRKNYTLKIPFTIIKPEFWFPNGMGSQKLYSITVDLICDSMLDIATKKVGLRNIEVVNKKDVDGQSFYLMVNGKKIFSKGANLVPLSSFPSEVTHGRYNEIFDRMIEANFNTIRVWGGGIYEDDYFYNKADEKGILVWQDFMFACTMYPSDTLFMRKVGQEAIYNIKRLRHHASLALWCGNNEIDVGWKNWGWQSSYSYSKQDSLDLVSGYEKIFKETLPNTVNNIDSGRFYFHSTPISNWGEKKDFAFGDNHYWGVWHGDLPFETYHDRVPRFMSEYGFQSYPSVSSIDKMVGEGKDAETVSNHQKARNGIERISKYMNWYYHEPKDFEKWIYVNQLLQADAMRIAIEAHRTSQPFCNGTLFWQLNDCWPAVSWSVVDFYGGKKAAYFAVKRAYKPTLISSYVENDSLKIAVVSDEKKVEKISLNLKLIDFTGNVLFKEKLSIEKSESNKNGDILYRNIRSVNSILKNFDRDSVVLKINTDAKSDETAASICYFDTLKNVRLPKVVVKYNINKVKDGYLVELKNDVLAKNVYLSVVGDASAQFTENYFDMLPQVKRKIFFTSSFDLNKVVKNFKIITLADTY